MTFDASRYPKNWREIVAQIRERAGDKCEWCGIPNGAVGYREGARFVACEGMAAEAALADGFHLIRIVCTTAHLGVDHPDGTPGDKHDKMDCRPENLAFLCQRCHLNYDRDEHTRNAARTRRQHKIEQGQTVLELEAVS